jgi:hypothetical protein
MENIEKNLVQIQAGLLGHIINANAIGVYEFEDIVDNFIDCYHEDFECDAMELKKYLMNKFN